MKISAICFCIVTFMTSCMSNVISAEQKNDYQILWEGIKHEREKLISGTVKGEGSHSLVLYEGKDVSLDHESPVSYYVRFDFSGDLLRVDRRESNFSTDIDFRRNIYGQYIEDSDSIRYCSYPENNPTGAAIVFIATPKDRDYDFVNRDLCFPLDIRCIGLNTLTSFVTGRRKFLEVVESFQRKKPDVMIGESPGILRFEYHIRDDRDDSVRKNIFWVDTKNGYTVQRCLNLYLSEYNANDPLIMGDRRISWLKVKDVWVPKDISFEDYVPGNNREKFVMSFDWESVNEPVDEEHFNYCNFSGVWDQTPVVEVPLKGAEGKSKQLGIFYDLCGTKEGRLLQKKMEAEGEKRVFRVRLSLLFLGVGLIAIAITMRIFGNRKNKKDSTLPPS